MIDQTVMDAFNAVKEQARRQLEAPDGPLNQFVVVSRAVRLARSGKFQPVPGVNSDPLAEALDEVLYYLGS